MGEYLNPGNINFQEALASDIYIDKTELLRDTNKVIRTQDKYLCVSRPRRFGKSMTLNMLAAYYSRGSESREMFSGLKIATSPDFEKHLNKYNVVRINVMQELAEKSISEMLTELKAELIEEIREEFPKIKFPETANVAKFFTRVYNQTNVPFVFLLDEWDSPFRERGMGSEEAKSYLYFLRDLLKDRAYVALAYMTGILPIKKYGEHSALNMFTEYSMTNASPLQEFTGFTEDEVTELCLRYDKDVQEMRRWYNGYTVNGIAIYTSERYYFTTREMPTGKGFADIVFVPRVGAPVPALVVELKWNKSAETALDQIKAKQYTDCLQGYQGQILLVGINYDPKDKKHTCKIERIEK